MCHETNHKTKRRNHQAPSDISNELGHYTCRHLYDSQTQA